MHIYNFPFRIHIDLWSQIAIWYMIKICQKYTHEQKQWYLFTITRACSSIPFLKGWSCIFESFQKFCELIKKRNENLVFESNCHRWCWWLWCMDTAKDDGKYWGTQCLVFHSWEIDTLSINSGAGVRCDHHCYNYHGGIVSQDKQGSKS